MEFVGKDFMYLGKEEVNTKDGRHFTFARFADPETFENFSLLVPERQGILLPPKERQKVELRLKAQNWNGRTTFRLVDIKAV